MKTLSVCSTYGRIPYLGRMLAAFVNQKYDDKHLVIINDDKNVDLCCGRKDVTILNCSQRLTVSDKRNMGISIGNYDLIFPWDDDDIPMPERISNHIYQYENFDINAYKNSIMYIISGNIFKLHFGSSANTISFKKSEWDRIGGYTNDEKFEDSNLYHRITKKKDEPDKSKVDIIYAFGGVNYHLSCYPMQFQLFESIAYKQLEDLRLLGKKFWIEPDQEEYNKCLKLKEMFDKNQKEIKIEHISDAKIKIPDIEYALRHSKPSHL